MKNPSVTVSDRSIRGDCRHAFGSFLCVKKGADSGGLCEASHRYRDERHFGVGYRPEMKFLKDYRIYKCDEKGK